MKILAVGCIVLSRSTLVTDGRTDGQTKLRPQDLASIAASHGNNQGCHYVVQFLTYQAELHCDLKQRFDCITGLNMNALTLMSTKLTSLLADIGKCQVKLLSASEKKKYTACSVTKYHLMSPA